MPFQDATNQSSAFKTTVQSLKKEPTKIKQIQLSEARKLSYEEEDDEWFEQFAFPADKNCKCCGKDQGTKIVPLTPIMIENNDDWLPDDQTVAEISFSVPSPQIARMDDFFSLTPPRKMRSPRFQEWSPVEYMDIPLMLDESDNGFEEIEQELSVLNITSDSGILQDNSSCSSSRPSSPPLIIPDFDWAMLDDYDNDENPSNSDNSIINQW